MKGQNGCFYDFGSFRVDVLKRQLMHDGEVLPLTSKAFATLLILVQRRGETVAKEELMNVVWADTAVEENNLTQQISTLRKTLGEQARSPQFIITIPGQGYSFIAPVKEIFDVEPESEKTNTEISVIQMKERKPYYLYNRNFKEDFRSYGLAFVLLLVMAAVLPYFFYADLIASKRPAICVLPFKSLNNNEKSSIYTEGIPSYVTAKIGNLPNMIVRPANAEISQKYFGQEQQNILEVGQENNVDAVLTGSTLREGENVQIIVHLWDVKNNRQIWAKVFTSSASDAINVQEAISQEIISAISRELLNS